ncbi:MAG: IclR family transcriptional regulator [Acinetobacter populi]|jgi:DNA-binding IclR family transcriptional regulator|uniref:IclR family transcriptional regulator n=1 Tax=Acinetobacter populi TaxID=1582270 RepID=UPI00235799D8|nr:IclR family transcriptional regulator [Acinetobacter populi]MCH4247478.1 IclR family transcriptional regulator [Acinetobacter populi]
MVNENRKIQSVERAMILLEIISAAGGKMRLVDLVKQTGLHKSTLHGLLNTLATLGYIIKKDNSYALGLRLREIAQPLADADQQLRCLFTPVLHALQQISQETCYLAVPCGTREYLYIDAIEGQNNLRLASPRGLRESLTTSAIGKVLLANDVQLLRSLRKASLVSPALEQELILIAQNNYALDLGEAEPDLCCLALPLRYQGKVVAALGTAGPSFRLDKIKLEQMAKQLISEKFDHLKL